MDSRRRMLAPGEGLISILLEKGCSSVRPRVWVSPRKIAAEGFQYLAVEMLVHEYSLCPSSGYGRVVYETSRAGRKYRIVLGRGQTPYDCVVSENDKECISWRELESRMPDPPFPLFVVDLSLWRLHSDQEKARLRIQLAMTLSVVRKYLWDRHLAITSVPGDAKSELQEVMGANRVFLTSSRPTELLWGLGAESVIILRPDAPEDLTLDDIIEADAFLIGGIVDLTPRKGVSRILDRMVPWGKPRRISLRGSTIGVPDRINRIVEIILRAMMEYGDVEKAIVASMTRRDLMRRLFVEIMRRAEKRGSRRVVRADSFRDLASWLPISWDDYLEAARKAKVEVVGVAGGDTSG